MKTSKLSASPSFRRCPVNGKSTGAKFCEGNLPAGRRRVQGVCAPGFLLALFLSLLTTNVLAALVAYEPYNYAIGNTVGFVSGTPTQTAGGGFSSGYNGNGGTCKAVTGLTYTGLGVNANALNQTASYSGENLASPVSSGTVYISFLFNMSVNPGGNRVGLEMNTGGTGIFVGFTAPYSASQGYWGVNKQASYNDNSGSLFQYPSANITYGTTYFCVVKLVDAGANWSGSIWINPTANTSTETPGTPDGTFTVPKFTISACSIVNPNGGNFNFDELRIGTTWADAVNYTIAAPSAPTGLSATPGANSVSLNWTPASGSPTSYNVKRSTTSGSGYVTISTAGAVTGTSFTDNVAGGQTYYYVVSAVNAGGESANSSEVSAAPTLAAPAAPSGLTATAGEAQVALRWSSAIAASGYNVKRSTTSGAETTITSISGTNYTDASVVNGTTYFYTVSATNSIGEGANSTEASATPYALVSVYEPFNYPAGSITNNTPATGAGLTGNWSLSAAGTINAAGLGYSNLLTANRAFQQSPGGQRDSVAFTTPRSSGTMYLSFLYNQVGNNGGNSCGLYLPGSGSTSLFVGLTAPYSGTAGSLGLASVTTTSASATGATLLSGAMQLNGAIVYNTTNLIVVKIDFNTSGANDTISLWLNPPAGTNAPGVAANLTYSGYDVGTINGVGFNLQGGGQANIFDEIRVGSSYGNVVSMPSPTVVTTVAVSTNQTTTASWTAYSTNVYQPQSSPDNTTWSNVGSPITGSSPNSIVDPANAAYYQVLEYFPVTTEVVANGGFDLDTGLSPDTAQNWSSVQSQPPVWINTDGHTALGCMDIAVTNTTASPNGSELQQDTLNQGNPVTPGASYNLSFWAKQISSGPSYVQQYNVQWLGAGSVYLGASGIVNFSGGNGTWAHITQNNLVAPAGAVTALIQILGNTGAVAGGYGEVLVDDVSLTDTAYTGGPNILVPTVQRSMSFTATVQTNGVTAGDSTGTVTFKTNSVQLSVNSVASGMANSLGSAINPPYTVTAIYSGDTTYLGSTGTLTVNGAGPSGSARLTNSISGGVLNLSWPPNQGWRLQMQTNSLAAGLGTNWIYVTDGTISSTNITVDKTKPTVFYRLKYP
jgi:hypothetical protein